MHPLAQLSDEKLIAIHRVIERRFNHSVALKQEAEGWPIDEDVTQRFITDCQHRIDLCLPILNLLKEELDARRLNNRE